MVGNSLSIDVEEYFQVENFAGTITRDDWDRQESRLVFQMDKILTLLSAHNVKATFFVLGWIAERHKKIIQDVRGAGHEVASHGYGHQLIYTQTPEEFREDLKKSKRILEDIIQEPVLGYRAPSFSLTQESIWALEILREEGFKYDSSIFPVHRDRGGLPQAKRYPHEIGAAPKAIWEFPISTARFLNQNIPYSGGGYFRLLPYWLIKRFLGATNQEGYPATVYLHPWEFDPHQPRIRAGSISRFRHYVNIAGTEEKLERLINDFSFKPIKDFL